WSFQNPDQDALAESVKAWAWTVKDVREHGGRVIVPDSERYIGVPSNVRIDALYFPPVEGNPREVFEEALSAFKEVGVTPIPVSDIEKIGDAALMLLEAADEGPRQKRL